MSEISAKSGIRSLLDSDPFRGYRDKSSRVRSDLDDLLSKEIPAYASDDTSLVVFGSLARGEWTVGSDLDWTYLIDGLANSDHLRISQKIEATLEKAGY
jgi:predicted nucleotidyltransferase